jgi:hypothetical protein
MLAAAQFSLIAKSNTSIRRGLSHLDVRANLWKTLGKGSPQKQESSPAGRGHVALLSLLHA